MERRSVLKLEEIPPGSSKLVSIEGKEVALFNVEGRFYALGNRCPHRSGPLVRGRIETLPDSGTLAVRCPIHGWLFELATGKAVAPAEASPIPSYEATCTAGEICLAPRNSAEAPT